jgi:hypothetical protein
MDRYKGIYRIESSRLDGWDYGSIHLLVPSLSRDGGLTTSSSPSWYFVTICTRDGAIYFGNVVDGEMKFNVVGEIAYRMMLDIPKHHKNLTLDEFVIMPNHIHSIIVLCGNHGRLGYRVDRGCENGRDVACNVSTTTHHHTTKHNHITARNPIPTRHGVHMSTISPKSGSLGSVIRSFKSAVTNWCRANGHPNFAWYQAN